MVTGQVVAQALLGAAAITMMSVAPPASGTMLAVPLGGTPAAALLGADVRLRGAGPWPGTLVIDAGKSDIFATAAQRGIILLGADARACSTEEKAGA
ncbi:hypothetical protein [Sphingomonas sp.]|uniref:hypothetical protein n=1 Tax=Sphingomonas sp. TaxID=28214 RepID=UPI001D8408F1|nr:hypothetical protein [Sphingomonas sp.]MBX9797769.1 hypothetical protein [Sphingomonas sp.]